MSATKWARTFVSLCTGYGETGRDLSLGSSSLASGWKISSSNTSERGIHEGTLFTG